MPEEWISAADAFRQVAAVTGPYSTPQAICSRAHAGLIKSKAAVLLVDDRANDDAEIPRGFWWARGRAALTQNWATGDFETWIDKTIHVKAFGVSFSRDGIIALVGPAEGRLERRLLHSQVAFKARLTAAISAAFSPYCGGPYTLPEGHLQGR